MNQKEYSKAYYKRKVRNKSEMTTEILTLPTRRFILNENPGWYIELFGHSEESLLSTELEAHLIRYQVGVIRRNGRIECVFSINPPGRKAGKVIPETLTAKQRDKLRLYQVLGQ